MDNSRRLLSPELLRPGFLVAVAVLLGLTFWAYSNHFDNPFQFDDAHTIEGNMAIRDMGNLPSFFSDAATFSTNPANRAWRPGVTTLNAINTAMSGGVPDPYWFHVTIFSGFLVLGFLLFLFALHLFRQSFPSNTALHWPALAVTGLFWLHTANAETINYIISRSDAGSTLLIVLGLLLFAISASARRTWLYMLAVLAAFFIKEPALMFPLLLLVYLWLFGTPGNNLRNRWPHVLISLGALGMLFLISRALTPATWTSGGAAWYDYLITQSFVIVHYVNTFFLPVNLSADTDWGIINHITDDRVLAGVFIIGTMLLLAWRCSKRQQTKGVTFGILWFFIALAPTSSVMPFAEVLNDHRTYFPYIGLIIAVVSGVMAALDGLRTHPSIAAFRMGAATVGVLLLGAHAWGTHQRCEVWGSSLTLWKDATEKSPGNGRAWMNYGLALMGQGNNAGAEKQFAEALRLSPYYSYANINMAIVKQRKGDLVMADTLYARALRWAPNDAEPYYYYARFLFENGRTKQAQELATAGLQLSANHQGLLAFQQVLNTGAKQPTTADGWLNLSLNNYNTGHYRECVNAAQQALLLKPDYASAWNNISAAYAKLGIFDSAAIAGKNAVALDPDNAQAKGNLNYALSQEKAFAAQREAVLKTPSHDAWINLSLAWFNVGNYTNAANAAEEALKLNPRSEIAYNNSCAANNKLGNWKRAIETGEQAVKLKPDWALAINNLAEARRGLAAAQK